MSERAPSDPYLRAARPLFGRALSTLDAEITSPTRGSFDRTWWCWKFTDFSAARFQEGAYVLAWLASSSLATVSVRARSRLVDQAKAAMLFWRRLQHADGSFDEAYPFERSLAATAFTSFYVGSALERLGPQLAEHERGAVLQTVERAAGWLANNGEYHGVLSNHLAAAAGALQIAGDLLGTDRFLKARDRYLGIIYREQHPTEGWLNEYGGADPGYQSHAMFYLADIERRTGNAELFERLTAATKFIAWFVHPDGTMGGEYASRGTKFAFPAAFEMLAPRIPSAASVAMHLRTCIAAGRGISAREMDAWNQFPLLNNLLFAADAAQPLRDPPLLPWRVDGARAVFPGAGLVVAAKAGRVLAIGTSTGGAFKLWHSDGSLVYEDCGYAAQTADGWSTSQGKSEGRVSSHDVLQVTVESTFRQVPDARFDAWRFLAFRLFTLTFGAVPALARALKRQLVKVLIRQRRESAGRLGRTITLTSDGSVRIEDRLSDMPAAPVPVARQVPFHMGSTRYVGAGDWTGDQQECSPVIESGPGNYTRTIVLGSGRPGLD